MPSKSTKDLDNPVPELILERMAAKNQNHAQAAREIGTTQAALQYVINRGRGLGRDLAPRVAKYLGMDEGDLFKMAGLAPAGDDDAGPDAFYESQLRTLFKQASAQQKRQIVDVANIIVQGGESPSKSKPTKGKAQHE